MFEFELNGRTVRVAEAQADTTLLDFLRAQGLTGAKEGCAEGECGACAVAMRCGVGRTSEYRAVNSCLMLLPMAAHREIYSVEALAHDGELNPVQQALAASGGSQCGYCTPGVVMTLLEFQRERGASPVTEDEVRRTLSGNLCRCTGYQGIVDATLSMFPKASKT